MSLTQSMFQRAFMAGKKVERKEKKPDYSSVMHGDEKFRAFIEKSSDVILVIGMDMKISYASPSFREMFGTESDGFMDLAITEFFSENVHADDIENLMVIFEKCLDKAGMECRAEFRLKHRDGTMHNLVAVGMNHLATPSIQGLVINVRDITEQKIASEALRRNEELLRTMIENVNDIVWKMDENTVFTYVSPSVESVLGYKPEELVGKRAIDYFPEENLSAIQKDMQARVVDDPGPGVSHEYRMRAKGGSLVPVEVSSRALRDDKGQLIGFSGVTRDIRERKRLEKEAANYLKVAEVMFICIDTGGIVTLANDKAAEVLDLPVNEIIGKNWFDNFIPERLRPEIKKISEQIQAGTLEPAKTYENPVLRKDGTERLILWENTSLIDDSGKITGHLSSGLDITESREHEKVLKEVEAKFRDIVENLDEGYYSCTMEGVLLDHNPALNKMLGYDTSKDLRGGNLPNFWQNPDDRAVYVKELLAHGKVANYTINVKSASGDSLVVLANSHIVRDGQGAPLRIEGTFTDITEMKRMADTVTESESKFRQLAENIDIVFWLTDWSEKKLLYVNKAYERIFGMTVESAYADRMSWKKAVHPDDMKRVNREFQDSSKKDEYIEIDYRIIVQGDERWIHEHAIPLKDGNGQVVRYINVAEDITEKKNAHLKTENMAKFPSENPSPIMRIADNGTLLFVNDASFKVLSHLKLAIGMKIPESLMDNALNAIGGGNTGTFEIENNGRVISFFTVRIPNSGYFNLYGRDITELKQAEEILNLKNRMLTSIADYTQAISFAPPDHLFTTIVTKLKEITGAAEVLINDYDVESSELVLRESTLSDEGNSLVKKFLGRKLIDFRSPVSKDMYREIIGSTIGRVQSLHVASLGAISKSVGQIIEKSFGFGRFLGLSLKHEGKLVGTILIAMKKGAAEPGDEELLAYASATANLLSRRKAELALAQNEERFRMLIEKGNDVVMVIDKNGDISYVSPSFTTVFGRAVEEIMGRPSQTFVNEYVHEEDIEKLAEEFAEVLSKPGRSATMECRFRHKDGKEHVLSATALNRLDEPAINGLVLNILDISERKLAEEEIRRMHHILQLGQHAARSGVWSWDISTGKQDWSGEMFELFGLDRSRDSASFESWRKAMHPDDRAAAEERVHTAIKCHERLNNEYRVVLPSGEVIWVNALGDTIYDGENPVRMSGICVDITERKRAETSLAASEVRYRRLFEAAKDGILILDAKTGQIVDVNPFLTDLLGFTREEFLGKKIWDIGFFKDIAANEANFLELQDKGYVRYEDMPLETKEGQKIHVEFVSNVYLINQLKVVQCNIRDITDRKAAERLKQLHELRTATYLALHEMADATEQELFDHCLEASMKITGSGLSFIGWMNPGETELTIYSWSRSAIEQCDMDEKQVVFPIAESGLWGECVRQRKPIIVNDYSKKHKGKKGLPKGHVPLKNLLCVPISDRGAIVAVVAVANKDSDYSDDDASALHVLINKMWEIHKRRQHEAEIDNLNSFLLSIRNLNQEIVKEQDFDMLLATSCKILTEIRGYIDVSIAFTDAETCEILPRAHYGEHRKDTWRYSPECGGEVPPCIREVISSNSSVILDKGHGICAECGFCDHEETHKSILVPMRNKSGDLMGIISACLESGRAIHPQEVPLFEEVAGDLVFAYEKICNEKALADSESLLQRIFEVLPVGLWFADKNGTLQRGNPAGVKIWGAEPKAAPSEYGVFKARRLPSGEEIAPDDWALAHTIREGVTITDELLEIDAFDGKTKTILNYTAPVNDENGNLQGAIVVNLDITASKQAEIELERHYNILRLAGMTAKFGGWSIDIKSNIATWSDAVAEIHEMPIGYSPSVKDGINFYAPEWRDLITKVFNDCAIKGIPYDKEMEIITTKGKRIWIRTTGEAVRDEKDNIVMVQGSFQDISPRKQLEEKLRDHNEKLLETVNSVSEELEKAHRAMIQQERLAVLGQMAASVSHELRNPLSVINNVAYYLKAKFPDADEKTVKMLELLEKEVDRSDRIIGNMLSFSKLKPTKAENIDVNDLVRTYLSASDVISGNVTVHEKLSDIPHVYADAEKLRQVLDNLVSNACQAMPDGGTLTISTKINKAGMLELSVKDTGHGMTMEVQSRMFEPLFSTKTTGFGLGLAIVKTLVADHGGEIQVKSKPGTGSEFTVILPVERRSD